MTNYTCNLCEFQSENKQSFVAHGHKHKRSEGTLAALEKTKETMKNIGLKAQNQYSLNPKQCQMCQTVLSYKQRHNKYCSSSCAAKVNNLVPKRIKVLKEKVKISKKEKNA